MFAGDTDKGGAEWSKKDGHDAFASFQDCNKYRMFCYVPLFYKEEFLVPWILRERNKDHLAEVAESVVVKTNLLDKMDPENKNDEPCVGRGGACGCSCLSNTAIQRLPLLGEHVLIRSDDVNAIAGVAGFLAPARSPHSEAKIPSVGGGHADAC